MLFLQCLNQFSIGSCSCHLSCAWFLAGKQLRLVGLKVADHGLWIIQVVYFFVKFLFQDKLPFILLKIAGTQNNMGLELLMNMLGGLGGGGLAVPNTPNGKISLRSSWLISFCFSCLLMKYIFDFLSASRRALCNSTATASRNGFLWYCREY